MTEDLWYRVAQQGAPYHGLVPGVHSKADDTEYCKQLRNIGNEQVIGTTNIGDDARKPVEKVLAEKAEDETVNFGIIPLLPYLDADSAANEEDACNTKGSCCDDLHAVGPGEQCSSPAVAAEAADQSCHYQVTDELEHDTIDFCYPVMLEEMEDSSGVQPEVAAVQPETATVQSPPHSPNVRMPMECSDDRDEPITASQDDAWQLHPELRGFSQFLLLGKGQFGEAYRTSRADGEQLVFKKIPKKHYKDEEFFLPFTYRHDSIVQMHEKLFLADSVFLVQDYVEGRTLEAVWNDNVRRGCIMGEIELDVLAWQMLAALDHLDRHRIVHRDIKPANIMRSLRDPKGIVYVLIDFGMSEQLMDGEKVRCVSGFRGSPAYTAPECCHECPKSKVCHRGYNTKADEWSLAITLMQMCSFQVPWHFFAKSGPDLLDKLRSQPELMSICAGDPRLVQCSDFWRHAFAYMLSPQACHRPDVDVLLDKLGSKHRLAIPDFDVLQ